MHKLRKAGEKAMETERVSISHHSVSNSLPAIHPHIPSATTSSTSTTPSTIPPAENAQEAEAPTGQPPACDSEPKEEPQPKIFQDFEERKASIVKTLFQHHTADGLGDPCPCNGPNAIRTTVCRECWHYEATCTDCFVDLHIQSPTHWAEVWSADRGFFVRHDISALPGKPYIHLGHGGRPCPNADSTSKETFTIVDLNGIHSTKVLFCGCGSEVDRADQFLNARLFPSSFRRPRMVFTMNLLRNFHVRHLASGEAAYDFIATLRHLTDDFFFKDAADPYDQFRDVFKIYRILEAEMRLGQLHGIDEYFPHRPAGCLTLQCPACIEFGINTTKAERSLTDPRLRHLYQICFTADGNFQANRYIKNSDIRRISFFKGKACFPLDKQYKVFVTRVNAKKSPEKTTCSYLNAINKQEKTKFLGTDVSGVLNIQCPHVFILSSVDLQYGERFVCTDYAVYHALLQRGIPAPIDLENLDCLFSYDISCHYEVKALERFRKQFPDVAAIIEKFRYTIPLVHVRNHKDNCTYLYSSAYVESAGHFHGETAEQPWAYLNPLGGQGRQMSPGNRHDMYIGAYDHWNFMKMVNLALQLFNDLMRASGLKDVKREIFIRLCRTYIEKVPEWNEQSRAFRDKSKKEVECVYRHKPSKLPSQSKIYQALVQKAESQLEGEQEASKKSIKAPALLLNHSISVRKLQVKIICTDAAYKKHETPSMKTKLVDLRSQLHTAIKRFRDIQASVTPQVAKDLTEMKTSVANSHPEKQCLYLPSDYDEADRTKLDLTELGTMEYQILEGAAYDALERLRTIVRLLSTLRKDENDNSYGQARHTKSKTQIIDATLKRDTCMKQYKLLRKRLISLGLPKDDPALRKLTPGSLNRKSTTATREIGDTYKTDGLLWASGAIGADRRLTHRPLTNAQGTLQPDVVGTQSSQPLKRKNQKKDEQSKKKPRIEPEASHPVQMPDKTANLDTVASDVDDDDESAGWIWAVKSSKVNISDAEVEEFLSEGNRVQWFRAEAEMFRWQEEWERKIIEFVRTIRSYDYWAFAWAGLASSSQSPGEAAAALKWAKRYQELGLRCEDIFKQAGFVYRRDARLQAEQRFSNAMKTQESSDIDPVPPTYTPSIHDSTGDDDETSESDDESTDESDERSTDENDERSTDESANENGEGGSSSQSDAGSGGSSDGDGEDSPESESTSGETLSSEGGGWSSEESDSEGINSMEVSSSEEELEDSDGGSEPEQSDSGEDEVSAGRPSAENQAYKTTPQGSNVGRPSSVVLSDETIIPFMQKNRDALERLLAAAMTPPPPPRTSQQTSRGGRGQNRSAPSRRSTRRGRGQSSSRAVNNSGV